MYQRTSVSSFALIAALAISLSTSLVQAQYGMTSDGSSSPLSLAQADGSITILSPQNGASLDGGSGIVLRYNIKLSPDGNHIHVYIDDQSPIIDRNVANCPCSIQLPELSAGEHTIVMKEATISHVLTGVEAKVSVNVK